MNIERKPSSRRVNSAEYRGFIITAHVLVLVCQLLAIYAISAPWAVLSGFPLDDAWIHQVVGRTFAQTGTLGFEAGHHGSGATSYFWGTLLAFNYRFLHLHPVAYTLAANLIAYLGTGQCLVALLRRAFVPGRAARLAGHNPGPASEIDPRAWLVFSAAVAGIACLGGNFLWFAFSGMEASWAAFLPLLAIVLFASPSASVRTAVGAGVAAGVMALTRPEAMALAPLMVLFTRRTERPWKHAVWMLAPWTAAIAIYFGSNLLLAGSWMPATLQGRRWLWAADFRALSPMGFFHAWFYRLEHYTLATAADAVAYIALALMLIGIWRLVRTGGVGIQLGLVWATAHMLTFLVLLPTPGHGGRYQPLIPVVFLGGAVAGACAFTLGALKLIRRTKVVPAILGIIVGAAPFAICGGLSASEWSRHQVNAVSHIRATEAGLGALVDSLPPGARVASFDIGAITFEAKRPIVEIGGLLHPETAKLLQEGRIWEYLRDTHVQYLILPAWYHDEPTDPTNFAERLALVDNPAITLEPVRELETRYDTWHTTIDATWNASPRQVLYRVHFTGKKGPNVPAVLAPALAFDDPAELLSRDARLVIDRSLSVLAGQNVHVKLEIIPENQPIASPAAQPLSQKSSGSEVTPVTAVTGEQAANWVVKVGRLGFDVRPPAKLRETISEAGMREIFGRSVYAYVDAEDYGGAALGSLRAITKIIRTYVDPTFHPQLSIPYPPHRSDRGFEVSFRMLSVLLGLLALAVIGAYVIKIRVRGSRGDGQELGLLGRHGGGAAGGRAMATSSMLPLLLAGTTTLALGVPGCNQSPADLTAAVESGAEVFVRMAEQTKKIDEYGDRGQTPLMRAAERNNPSIVLYLLSRGVGYDRHDPQGRTALHWAARYGHVPVVRALLAAGCAPSAIDLAGQTPLHLAARNGQVDVAEMLLAAKADPKRADVWGDTPLHLAAMIDGFRGRAIAKALLDAGATPATFNASGYTPLHVAALFGNVQVIEAYKAAGLDLSPANATGMTPADVALMARTDWAGQVIMEAGGKANAQLYALPPLHEAAKMNNVSRLLAALSYGSDPQWKYADKTAREVAVENGSKDAIAILDRFAKLAGQTNPN